MTLPGPPTVTWSRWVLHDPGSVLSDWTFERNPTEMDPPDLEPNIVVNPFSLYFSQASHHVEAHAVAVTQDIELPSTPKEWTFSGVVNTLAEHDLLQSWLELGHAVHVTTHFGVSYEIELVSVDTTRAGNARHPGRHKYVVHAIMLGEL